MLSLKPPGHAFFVSPVVSTWDLQYGDMHNAPAKLLGPDETWSWGAGTTSTTKA